MLPTWGRVKPFSGQARVLAVHKRRNRAQRPFLETLEGRALLSSGRFDYPAGTTANQVGFDTAPQYTRVTGVTISASPTDPTLVTIDKGPYAIDNGLLNETTGKWLFGSASSTIVAGRDAPVPAPFVITQSTTLGLYNTYGPASLHLSWAPAPPPPPPPPLADIALDSASVVGSNVKFTYHTTGNPGQFTIGLYESADLSFDSSDTLVTSQKETPPANSSSADTFAVSFKPNPAQPYLLVVVSPGIYGIQKNDLPAYLVTSYQLQGIMSLLSSFDVALYIGPLNEAMEEFQIDTPKREAAFLAQIAAESTDLTQWNQVGVPDVDARGNPNLAKGRGPIQVTNELTFSQLELSLITNQKINGFLGSQTVYYLATQYFGIDFIDDPQIMADTDNPIIGFRTSAWYWSDYKAYAHLNTLADSVDTSSFFSEQSINLRISQVVNGRTRPNGLPTRFQKYLLAIEALGIDQTNS